MSKKKVLTKEEFISLATSIIKDEELGLTVQDKADNIAIISAYKEMLTDLIDKKINNIQNSIDEADFNAQGSVTFEYTDEGHTLQKTFTSKLKVKDSFLATPMNGLTNEDLKSKYNLGDELIKAKVTTIYSLDKEAMYDAYKNNQSEVIKAHDDGVLFVDKVSSKNISITKKIKNI